MRTSDQTPKPGKYLRKTKKHNHHALTALLWAIPIALGLLCFFAAWWYRRTYGDTGFDSILYTLFSDLGGVQSGLILSFSAYALLPAVLIAIAVYLLLCRSRSLVLRLASLAVSVALVCAGAVMTGLPE